MKKIDSLLEIIQYVIENFNFYNDNWEKIENPMLEKDYRINKDFEIDFLSNVKMKDSIGDEIECKINSAKNFYANFLHIKNLKNFPKIAESVVLDTDINLRNLEGWEPLSIKKLVVRSCVNLESLKGFPILDSYDAVVIGKNVSLLNYKELYPAVSICAREDGKPIFYVQKMNEYCDLYKDYTKYDSSDFSFLQSPKTKVLETTYELNEAINSNGIVNVY